MIPGSQESCPCGSGELLPDCCGPYVTGLASAPTAEALMRSRYTAHVLGTVDYILRTVAPEKRANHDRAQIAEWASSVDWKRLEVLKTAKGLATDAEGKVYFRAWYKENGKLRCLEEDSRFRRDGDQWYYVNGSHPISSPRIQRNDPCPCGSGEKYKRCCG